jgi:hypothetical protein
VSENIHGVLIAVGRVVVIAPAQLPVRTAARTVLLHAERRVNKSNNPPPLNPLPPGVTPHNDILKANHRVDKWTRGQGEIWLGMFIALLSL